MLRPLSLVALLSIGVAACSSSASDADADPLHPSWLVGTLTGPSLYAYGNTSLTLELNADGTALSTDEDPGAYETTDNYVAETWSFNGQDLILAGKVNTTFLAAGCHLVQIVDPHYATESTTYSIAHEGPLAGCPQSEPALTETEQSLVGQWGGSGKLYLRFDDSRSVFWDIPDDSTNSYRWAIDDDGKTFHITEPNGSVRLTGTLTITGDALTLCTANNKCQTLPHDS